MTTYTLAEAKARLSKVIEEVEAGNTALITKHGHPAAVVIKPDKAIESPKRGLVGCLKKEFADWQLPEDFDRINQDEIITLFVGGAI